MRPHDTWTVLPHGEIEKLADNLYTVEGKLRMPLGETSRRMTLVRVAGDRLVIYSAIALDEAHMVELESIGRPAILIVPSAIHRLDVKPWKHRYPGIEVIAPYGARDKIGEVVPVDATAAEIHDPRLRIETVPGTDGGELAMVVDTGNGKTLVVNDLIFNLPRYHGVLHWGLRLLGFGPGHPSMPKLVKLKLVKHDDEVRDKLRQWAALDGLERILVSHGAPITNPRETLLQLAAA